MATAISPSATTTEAAQVGGCFAPSFPETDIQGIITGAGHTVAFWHDATEEVIAACLQSPPDLLVIGARQPDPILLRAVGTLEEEGLATKVILVCERSGKGDLRKALEAGVSGFVSVAEVDSALLPVIDVVLAGQVSVPGSRSGELQQQILTPREKQILGLVVMGMTNGEIAGKLYLAESTIKSHLSSAFAKLGVSSRSEAAAVILDPKSNAGLGVLTIPTG